MPLWYLQTLLVKKNKHPMSSLYIYISTYNDLKLTKTVGCQYHWHWKVACTHINKYFRKTDWKWKKRGGVNAWHELNMQPYAMPCEFNIIFHHSLHDNIIHFNADLFISKMYLLIMSIFGHVHKCHGTSQRKWKIFC